MLSRRSFLGSGFSALAWGLSRRSLTPPEVLRGRPSCPPSGAIELDASSPFRSIPDAPLSTDVDGLPFEPWFTGDDWDNGSIPFHYTGDYFNGGPPPEPQEQAKAVVVGGGLSGLSTALLLRRHRPILLEMRERFGGQAMGEQWHDLAFPIGSAYFITPDAGSFLGRFYRRLGLHRVRRESLPPDPVELNGTILQEFWSGAGLPENERAAMERYAAVVRYFAEEAYPDIPLSDDPALAAAVIELDRRTFRQDLEDRMGMPLTPLLAAAVQGYFYSSFGIGMDAISAASGWNFVAAEEYGRWVLPGGNAYLAWSMWRELTELERLVPPRCRPHHLRAGCRVIDIRPRGANVQVTYIDSAGLLRSIEAQQCVVALPKHVAKWVLHGLQAADPDRWNSIHEVHSQPYLVANVLLDAPIQRDFYDCFLLGDGTSFPMTDLELQERRPVTDLLRGDYAQFAPGAPRSVLSAYWPLPWPDIARFSLIQPESFRDYTRRFVPQLRAFLDLLEVPVSAVRQVRLTRWGHAMPIARPGFIADGHSDRIRAALHDNTHFVNQDNFALPAVENCLLEAERVAREVDRLL